MRFQDWHLLGLLVILAIIVGINVYRRKDRRAFLQFSAVSSSLKKYKSFRVQLLFLAPALKIVGIVLCILALARPQESNKKIKRNVDGIDIVVALDISDSMLIEDMQPINRLESSKEVIKKFIEGRNSDRIGLVVFAGESYTRVPPTLDYPILQKSLKEITTENTMKMGTAIGVALANALARLQDSTAKAKIVILLTDGASNTGTIAPEDALEIAKGYGIKVYTIATGKEGQAMLPVYRKDIFGKTIKNYVPMMSSVNRELLAKIASETGGEFYFADDTETLKAVFQKINRLEKSKIDVNEYTKYTEIFKDFLLPGILLLLLSLLLDKILLRRVP